MQLSFIGDDRLSDANSKNLYIVRIFAAQTVLVGHLLSFFGLTILKDATYFPYIQSLAVLVFFLLSGILTDYSIQRNRQQTLKSFIRGRFLRIYEFLFPALLFVFLVDLCWLYNFPETYSYDSTFNVQTFAKSILMMPVVYETFGSARPLWTLYFEWWLYIFYGYLMLVCANKVRKKQLVLGDLLIIIVLVYILLDGTNKMPLLAFLFGVLINRVYKLVPEVNMALIIFIVVFFVVWSAIIRDAYHFTELLLLSVILLFILARGKNKNYKMRKEKLLFLSGCTYPLYLTHYTIIELIMHTPFLSFSPWTTCFLCFIVCNGFAVLFYCSVKKANNKIRAAFQNKLERPTGNLQILKEYLCYK